ncbi:MAG TPA: hypothetical protein VI300_14675 [Solirubrobacter sp.]
MTVDPEARVCPFCGRPPGQGVFCERCGRNLSAVERLPTASELAAGEPADVQSAVRAFLDAMRAAGNPGTVTIDSGKPRAFRRTPQLTGWIVVPVDREDFATPRRYEPGLVLSVDGTFHRLDSDLRGYGQRDFPHYQHRASSDPVEPPAGEDLVAALRSALDQALS